jgi:hypothetical protein
VETKKIRPRAATDPVVTILAMFGPATARHGQTTLLFAKKDQKQASYFLDVCETATYE